jgi:hypothetical protein
MKPRIVKPIILAVLFLSVSACREIYEPDLQPATPSLVVEGLITDRPGRHMVKLSKSLPYRSKSSFSDVTGATVRLADADGHMVMLTEDTAGVYVTPDYFRAVGGQTYTLHIDTPEGGHYRSAPQTTPEPLRLGQVEAELVSRPFYRWSNVTGRVIHFPVDGHNLHAWVAGNGKGLPKMRLATSLLLNYYSLNPAMRGFVCWIHQPITNYLESDVAVGVTPAGEQRLTFGYIPAALRHMLHIGFPEYTGDRHPENHYGGVRIVEVALFGLNDDAYEFHMYRNKQLSEEGRIFDPIAAQLPGNVVSVSNPGEPVFGLFEVSSEVRATFQLKMNPARQIQFIPVGSLEDVPDHGCWEGSLPFLPED